MQRASTIETRDLYWFAPWKRVKAVRPVATCLYYDLVEWRIDDYKMAMPMKVSMITTGRIASYLYPKPTCPTTYIFVP